MPKQGLPEFDAAASPRLHRLAKTSGQGHDQFLRPAGLRAFAEAVEPGRCGVVPPRDARLSGIHSKNIERRRSFRYGTYIRLAAARSRVQPRRLPCASSRLPPAIVGETLYFTRAM